MGCTDSKSAETQNQQQTTENNQNNQTNDNQNKPADDGNKENETGQTSTDQTEQKEEQKDDKKDDEVYVTVEEATTYVSNELGISNEKASIIVAKVNKCEDGRIANKELVALWNAIKAKRDEIRPKFAAYDQDNSGTVSVEEAYTVLKEVFAGIEEKSVRSMIIRFDENNTGKMNFNEFVFFYAHTCAKKEKIRERFNQLDADDSGDISSDEAVGVIMDECCVVENQAKSLVDDFDQNKDGKLNKAEFDALFIKLF